MSAAGKGERNLLLELFTVADYRRALSGGEPSEFRQGGGRRKTGEK